PSSGPFATRVPRGGLGAFARPGVVLQSFALLRRIHAALLERGLRLLALGVARGITPAEVGPLIGAAHVLRVLLLARLVAIRHAFPVGGVVLERRLVRANLPIGVDVVVPVDVDVHIATAPVAAAPERARDRDAGAERESRGEPAGDGVAGRRGD